MVVLGGGAVSYERGTPAASRHPHMPSSEGTGPAFFARSDARDSRRVLIRIHPVKVVQLHLLGTHSGLMRLGTGSLWQFVMSEVPL